MSFILFSPRPGPPPPSNLMPPPPPGPPPAAPPYGYPAAPGYANGGRAQPAAQSDAEIDGAAGATLALLMLAPQGAAHLASAGGPTALLPLLRSSRAPLQAAIARAGGIEPLIALARDGTDGQKEYAAVRLSS